MRCQGSASEGRGRSVLREWRLPSLVGSSLLTILFIGLPAAELAGQQAGQISGQVLSAETQGPLAQVQVLVEGTGLGTLTNAQGSFTIQNVPVGTHQLRAERIGYGTEVLEVTVGADETVSVELELRREALGLDDGDHLLVHIRDE